MNTVIRKKGVGIQTCLPCQHEIKDAVTDVVEELLLNVENQFLDDALDSESIYNNTSKSEYENEYDTEYEPDSSSQLDQSTCLTNDTHREKLLEQFNIQELVIK